MLFRQGRSSAAVSRGLVGVHAAWPALPLLIRSKSDGQRAMCLFCHLKAALQCPEWCWSRRSLMSSPSHLPAGSALIAPSQMAAPQQCHDVSSSAWWLQAAPSTP